MFKTKEVTAADAALSFPLVSCRYPGLTLQRWTAFVCAQAKRGATARLTALVDSKGRIHALFSHQVVRAQGAGPALNVSHIATFRLAGNAIYRAFDHAIEQIAFDNGCREVAIVSWGGADPEDGPALTPEDVPPGRRLLSIEPAFEPHAHLH